MLHACIQRFDVTGDRGNILGWDGEVNKACVGEWQSDSTSLGSGKKEQAGKGHKHDSSKRESRPATGTAMVRYWKLWVCLGQSDQPCSLPCAGHQIFYSESTRKTKA
jgi:hypothetical protein